MAPAQLLVLWHPKVLLCRAALWPACHQQDSPRRAGSRAGLPQGLAQHQQQHLAHLGDELQLWHRPQGATESPGRAKPSPARAAQPRPVSLWPWPLQPLLSWWEPPSSFCCPLPPAPASSAGQQTPPTQGLPSLGTGVRVTSLPLALVPHLRCCSPHGPQSPPPGARAAGAPSATTEL